MEFTVKVVMEDRLEALMDRLIAALESHQGGGCCKEIDPAAELKAKMKAEKKTKSEPKPKPEPEPEPKPEPEPEPKPEPVKAVSMDDVRKALGTYAGGDADKRAAAVEMLKEFHPSGRLLRIPPKDFGAVLTRLAAL